MKIKQTLTARNQFIEISTQTIENTDFLELRFLHFFWKDKKGDRIS